MVWLGPPVNKTSIGKAKILHIALLGIEICRIFIVEDLTNDFKTGSSDDFVILLQFWNMNNLTTVHSLKYISFPVTVGT